MLAACSSNPLDSLNPFTEKEDESQRGRIGFVSGFLGGVTADEPRAVLIGRDILSAGGTAIDAAVAVSLALSVTLPSSAGLGGGGSCLVYDSRSKRTETLDFRPAWPKRQPTAAAGSIAVPGLVRGIAALHAKYGRLKWSQLVVPAENLARFGNRASRALAHDLNRMPPAMRADPGIRAVFGQGRKGGRVREGDFFKQLDLSAVLGRLRARGAGDFYVGPSARALVDALAGTPGAFTVDDLRAYSPRWLTTVKVPYIKNTTLHFPLAGPQGALAAQIVAMMIENDEWEDASAAERAHLLAEMAGRAHAGRGRWQETDGSLTVDPARLVDEDVIENMAGVYRADRHTTFGGAGGGAGGPPGTPAGTAFVVVDRSGSAAACGLTLNRLFGAGRIAAGTGIVLAALPGEEGGAPHPVAATLLIDHVRNTFFFAAAAAGGSATSSVLAAVTVGALMGRSEETLEMAMAAKRLHNDGVPDVTYFERGLADPIVAGLKAKGHRVSPVPAIGISNAILCATGVPNKEEMSCSIRTDPRGFGLASGTE